MITISIFQFIACMLLLAGIVQELFAIFYPSISLELVKHHSDQLLGKESILGEQASAYKKSHSFFGFFYGLIMIILSFTYNWYILIFYWFIQALLGLEMAHQKDEKNKLIIFQVLTYFSFVMIIFIMANILFMNWSFVEFIKILL